jgi:formylglycine-generating enzyme required for sulfatase activity
MRSVFLLLFSLSVSVAVGDEPTAKRSFAAELGMEFVKIPAGSFTMGSNETAADLKKAGFVIPEGLDPGAESPARTVRMSEFRMQTTEVTRGQFAEFVRSTNYKTDAEKDGKGGYGFNAERGVFEQDSKYTWRDAGFLQTDKHPLVNVSWNDADAFATWMTFESKKRAETVRYLLPTEAQFEYAIRAGATTRFATGDNPQSLEGHANVQDASLERRVPNLDYAKDPSFRFDDGVAFTAVVGSYPKNAFGLYDMQGNMLEWCRDWYDAKYYSAAPDQDPPGLFACCAAAPGATCRTTFVVRPAAAALRRTDAAAAAFVWCWSSLFSRVLPLRFGLCYSVTLMRFLRLALIATRAAWRASLKFQPSPCHTTLHLPVPA